MKLRKHREDVKDLKLMNDAHVQDIARRYMRLIRLIEAIHTYSPFSGVDYDKIQKVEWRVLKDAVKEE